MRGKQDTAVRISLLKSGFGNNQTRRAAAMLRLRWRRRRRRRWLWLWGINLPSITPRHALPHYAPANSDLSHLYSEGAASGPSLYQQYADEQPSLVWRSVRHSVDWAEFRRPFINFRGNFANWWTNFTVIIWVDLTESGVVENMLLGRIFELWETEIKKRMEYK